MKVLPVAFAAAMVGVVAMSVAVAPASAQDRRTFSGCVVERTPDTVTLLVAKREQVIIGTSWLDREELDGALADCVTVIAVRQPNGGYMAESIEAGDEPNEVNSLTRETTRDREDQEAHNDDDDDN